jgi:hypothetical protein
MAKTTCNFFLVPGNLCDENAIVGKKYSKRGKQEILESQNHIVVAAA